MELNQLSAISPVDGRYRKTVAILSEYFSEYALIKYRVRIEIAYLKALADLNLPGFTPIDSTLLDEMEQWWIRFSYSDAEKVKNIEKKTNHDVKAVEYFVKEKIQEAGRTDLLNFVHFGLTSQDINNTAVPLSLRHAAEEVIFPGLVNLMTKLEERAEEWKDVPMLAFTHGQPASPTRLGKEIQVFHQRLTEQMKQWLLVPYAAKFGGATGNLNAHYVAYPNIDWHDFSQKLVEEKLGLKRSFPTTQIEHYDHLAAWLDACKRINTILIDLCRDCWMYISMDYFNQQIKEGEVGSSAMPHKVNPIDFENAEGNLGVANALLQHLSEKLPISRLQRDLTDSTVLRNLGVPLAHTLIAYQSILKGLDKLLLNRNAIQQDLAQNYAVVAEAIQTILRRENYPNPYEALRDYTRGRKIDRQAIEQFVQSLQVSESLKAELLSVTPENYTGK